MKTFNYKTAENYFFIGIAGAGMSAIAQYLADSGKTISGSDRLFSSENKTETQIQLENKGIKCFPQDCSGISENIQAVVISTAIEPTVPEYKLALETEIPIIMRSDLLAEISFTKNTIAISGTSGKSTVTAMIFHILHHAKLSPSLITGAGLVSIQKTGEIGNAVYGNGDFLVIEVDESDGSIVKYKPQTGVILNIEKDHKELSELDELFDVFRKNIKKNIIVNRNNDRCLKFSNNIKNDFGFDDNCGFIENDFKQNGFSISFKINDTYFELNQPGKHNMENAAAAVSACVLNGVSILKSAEALKTYEGIYRRHQIIGNVGGITIIDDYAHNPAKIAASIKACQIEGSKLITWFQPHGFGPTRFLRNEFVKEISNSLRENDEIWMSEIYYAGGSVSKDISSKDLINDISKNGKRAFFIEKRENFVEKICKFIKSGDVILLCGARDPSLSDFASHVFNELSKLKN